jgi:hypothetical protein
MVEEEVIEKTEEIQSARPAPPPPPEKKTIGGFFRKLFGR